MIYVGMDVSFKSFEVYAIDERKKVVFKGPISPDRGGLKQLVKELGKGPKLIAFEAGNQMKWIALALREISGVHVHVVHPNEVKWITESQGKTDRVDARKLAELARGDLLPMAVHIVDGDVRKLRELVRARQTLVGKRVAMINSVRGWVAQEGVRLPAKFFQGPEWGMKLERMKASETLRIVIKTYMQAIEALESSERELLRQIRSVEDKRIDLLKTIPAIGELASRVLVGALDDVGRFRDQKAVANYGALTPTIRQSGTVVQLGHINRDGRHEVRHVLLQCAHTITRMKSYGARPLKEFYERVAQKRGRKIAIVALARKLLTTAYGVLKSGCEYDPSRLSPKVA